MLHLILSMVLFTSRDNIILYHEKRDFLMA